MSGCYRWQGSAALGNHIHRSSLGESSRRRNSPGVQFLRRNKWRLFLLACFSVLFNFI